MIPKHVPFWILLITLLGSIAIALNTPMPWQLWWDACSLALGIWIAIRIASRAFELRRQKS